MSDFSNQLTPAETERLALLAEECAEVIQIVGKILRHGYESYHPDTPEITNRRLLEKELGDLEYAHLLMHNSEDVNPDTIQYHFAAKGLAIKPYLHHQGLK